MFWSYASPSGTNTSTDNPLVYKVSSTECAIQAMFVPKTNSSLPSTINQTGTSPFAIPISLGGTTSPAAGTYTNYSIGQVVGLTATASNGFKFMYWLVPGETGDKVSMITTNTLSFNVPANACALQAFFAPNDSNIPLPTTTIDEFSSAATIIIVALLTAVIFGAYRRSARTKPDLVVV